MVFHHIGIATENILQMLEHLYKHFEVVEVAGPVFDRKQNGTVCMATLQDGTRLELVSGEVVKGLLKKRRYLYHSCFLVRDMEEKVKGLEEDGYRLISEPKEAILFQGRKVCFLSGEMGMVELLEDRLEDVG